jgi:hypothetical protein
MRLSSFLCCSSDNVNHVYSDEPNSSNHVPDTVRSRSNLGFTALFHMACLAILEVRSNNSRRDNSAGIDLGDNDNDNIHPKRTNSEVQAATATVGEK